MEKSLRSGICGVEANRERHRYCTNRRIRDIFPRLFAAYAEAIFASILVILYVPAAHSVASDDIGLEELRTKAVPKWKELRSAISQLAGEADETIAQPTRGGETRRNIRFCLREPLTKFEIRRIPDTGRFSVYGSNTLERFEVDRNGSGLPPFVSDYIAGVPSKPLQPDTPRSPGAHYELALPYYRAIPLASMFVDKCDLCDFFDHHQVRVESFLPPQDNGLAKARIAIIFDKENEYLYDVAFFAKKSWRVSSWSRGTAWGTDVGEVSYYEEVLGGAYPSFIITKSLDKSGNIIASTSCRLSKPAPCIADAESFSLASYGLTPADVGNDVMISKARHRWVLLALNALFVLFLGWFVLRRWLTHPSKSE
jgi:hypothetical protein